jgi:hypothetical protein
MIENITNTFEGCDRFLGKNACCRYGWKAGSGGSTNVRVVP